MLKFQISREDAFSLPLEGFSGLAVVLVVGFVLTVSIVVAAFLLSLFYDSNITQLDLSLRLIQIILLLIIAVGVLALVLSRRGSSEC